MPTCSFVFDDVQEFDSKCDGIPLSMTKIPPDDISSASQSVDDRSGRPDETQANKHPKTNKMETTTERDPFNSAEWLQEFTENLVDDEIPAHGDSHAVLPNSGSRAEAWCRTWPLTGSIRAKRNPEKLAKVPADRKPEVIHTDFRPSLKISPGIIAFLHHTPGLLQEQCAE